MVKRYIPFCFMVFLLICNGCAIVSKKEKILFEIKDASYQSWMVNENEKGTNITIKLVNVKAGVEFDSIVFRSNRLPVASEPVGDTIILTSILNVGIERLPMDKQPVNLSDRLMYRHHGKNYSVDIKSFKRKETKFLK